MKRPEEWEEISQGRRVRKEYRHLDPLCIVGVSLVLRRIEKNPYDLQKELEEKMRMLQKSCEKCKLNMFIVQKGLKSMHCLSIICISHKLFEDPSHTWISNFSAPQ